MSGTAAYAFRYTLYVHALPIGAGLRLEPWPRIRLSAEAAGVIV